MVLRSYLIVCFVLAALSSHPLFALQAAARSSTSTYHSATQKKPAAKSTTVRRRKRSSPRLRRMHQAFVASTTLKPMARQLIQDRTPAAYAGVQAYAVRHSREDAGALAWLVIGYARILDHSYAQAIEPLNRAKPRAGDLGDYVNYYLGTAYYQAGRLAEAIATLGTFDKAYPDSLLIRDNHVVYANALIADGRASDAVELLENDRQPMRADLELVLGRAYEADNQPAKALSIFRNLYYTMPLSWEASQVQDDLNKLAASAQAQPVTLDARLSRADLLEKGKQFSDAASEYRDLLNEVASDQRIAIQVELAEALRHSGQNRDAKKILESMQASTPEVSAQRLFNLGEIARSANDDDEFLRIVDQLRQQYSASPWLEQSLLSAGNIYLLRRDYDKAIDCYRELQQRFPNGGRASYAHWKAAWLTLRQGRNDQAKKDFEDQIAWYPSSSEVPAALYWRGRLAEEDNDSSMAQAYYRTLSLRYRNFYYGELARQRLLKLKVDVAGDDPPHYAVLDRVPPINNLDKMIPDEVPTDNLRVQKAELLANGALTDFAVRELNAAAQEEKGNWAPAEIARLYEDVGRYDMAIETLKHAAPNYFAVDLPILPRSYWEALFPRAYWPDLRKYASANALDPYLVASLIRQESEFNPNAVSHANAVGLMQLLPKVGRGVAKQEKIRHFSLQQLFTPTTNLRLGTRYFRSMVDKFGSFEYALAAYNAGTDRVQDWMGQGAYRDPQEFVESIPFTETREYVQNILRNANVYRQLYGTP
ncbi:MAG TPA: transglycosylase SLT domain-containing protein [Terriglobales bacterium]|nr:transglycosylase SLT domain-containing protein [Terriglobales bacterium]